MQAERNRQLSKRDFVNFVHCQRVSSTQIFFSVQATKTTKSILRSLLFLKQSYKIPDKSRKFKIALTKTFEQIIWQEKH